MLFEKHGVAYCRGPFSPFDQWTYGTVINAKRLVAEIQRILPSSSSLARPYISISMGTFSQHSNDLHLGRMLQYATRLAWVLFAVVTKLNIKWNSPLAFLLLHVTHFKIITFQCMYITYMCECIENRLRCAPDLYRWLKERARRVFL